MSALASARRLAETMASGWNVPTGPLAFDFAGGLSAALLDVPATEVEAPKSDAHIFSLVTSAIDTMSLWLDGKPQHADAVRAGAAQIVRAGQKPQALASQPFSVLHVYIPAQQLRVAAEAASGRYCVELEIVDPLYQVDDALTFIGSELVSAISAGSWRDRLWLDTLGQALKGRLIQRWSRFDRPSTALSLPSIADWRIRRTIEDVEARLSTDFGMAELAAGVGLTERHYAALFRAATGLPPHRWVVRRRIERACELLADPRRSITDIALEVGFASSQHFATVFRRQMGMTPGEYRRGRVS